jgi:hypothetical protein
MSLHCIRHVIWVKGGQMFWNTLSLGINIFNFPRFGFKLRWNKEVSLKP